MEYKRKKLDRYGMEWATSMAINRVTGILELSDAIRLDSRREERMRQHECKACFYPSTLAGQAITKQPCSLCGKDQMYGSTNTSTLCLECAKASSLCRHCGGDLEMRSKRRNWPAGYKGEDTNG